MSLEILQRHRAAWDEKEVLRLLYTDWYGDIRAQLAPGRTVEIGGGTGNFKAFVPESLCTDIVAAPWVDAVVDAQALPFADGEVGNLVLVDSLHHIENPALFFREAARVLRPGGRVIILDPYVSWLSWGVYRFLHPEPTDLSADPFPVRPPEPGRRAFDANQAVATIFFEKRLDDFRRSFPALKPRLVRRLSFFAYPLSGGFEHPSLIPVFAARFLLAIERWISFLGRWLAFRVLVVLERA